MFFPFYSGYRKKLKELKIIQKKITKKSFELIKYIELICFIPPKYIDYYIKFLKSKLNDDKEKHLFEYLYKTWFSKNYNIYNYYELFENNNLKEVI